MKFTIFGVLDFSMQAAIRGKSVTSTDPKVYNFNYAPTLTPTSNGQTVTFKGVGEKFTSYGKSIGEIKDNINKAATGVINFLSGVSATDNSVKGKIKSAATAVQSLSSTADGFGKVLSKISSGLQTAGTVFSVISGIIGIFSGGTAGPAAMPSYSSYNFELQGTLTAKSVEQTFIIRLPASIQPNTDNAPYFNCPLGIFNLKNTPQADVVTYQRLYKSTIIQNPSAPNGYIPRLTYRDFKSYRIRNNIAAVFNEAAGLDIVSVKAAIVGQILPNSDGTASYDILEQH